MENRYIAVVADIKSSKHLEERAKIQEKLHTLLQTINTEYAADIAANFLITLGDEFQGILHSGARLLEIILHIKAEMAPVALRFGVGIGDILTAINPVQAIGADGPAFYCAREAINRIRKTETAKESYKTDICLLAAQENKDIQSVNHMLSLLYGLEQGWTQKQRALCYHMLGNRSSQSRLAAELGIRQSSVSAALHSANYYTYSHGYDYVQALVQGVMADVL